MLVSRYLEEEMADAKKVVNLREGVIKYTKPPVNKTPPSQRTAGSASTKKN
jgi:hypothetical protein